MKKDYLFIICVMLFITFFLGIFYFIINDNRKLTITEILIKEPILFIESVVAKPINLIKEDIKDLKNNKKIIKNNKKIEDYNIIKANLKEKEKRIKELEELININHNLSNYKAIYAGVINREVSSWYQTLTIDKGSNDKIENNQAVIDKNGLIGKIIKVTPHTSTVKLITGLNSNYNIAVNIINKEDSVFGILSDYRDGYLIINGIDYNKEIFKNSIVTTSGLDNIFPSGLIIGSVDSIKKDEYDLEQIVSVKAASTFDDINYVKVLKREE